MEPDARILPVVGHPLVGMSRTPANSPSNSDAEHVKGVGKHRRLEVNRRDEGEHETTAQDLEDAVS